jgi:hypothetical protein
LFFLGTGCATIIHEAVQKDLDANKPVLGKEARAGERDDEALEACPDGKILYEDCRVTPCKVTCEDPEELRC